MNGTTKVRVEQGTEGSSMDRMGTPEYRRSIRFRPTASAKDAFNARRRSRRLARSRQSVEQTAPLAPEWGRAEVRRPLDATNSGPFMGWPSQ